jgi:hypothetical protein
MEGKTARGASSPAKPALHIPEPLSITNACTSSDILKRVSKIKKKKNYTKKKAIQKKEKRVLRG